MTNYKLPSQCYSVEREGLSQRYPIMCEKSLIYPSRINKYLSKCAQVPTSQKTSTNDPGKLSIQDFLHSW